jgi:hypothetical protein
MSFHFDNASLNNIAVVLQSKLPMQYVSTLSDYHQNCTLASLHRAFNNETSLFKVILKDKWCLATRSFKKTIFQETVYVFLTRDSLTLAADVFSEQPM